ncbi:MAG: APC family permease [Firmicutes bacterium]|nr:APC family permease [Bacillota bacterium]
MFNLFFSYLGFEALAQQAGETTEPEKTLPRIFLIGVGSAVIIYGLMALVAVGNVPTAQLANASAPMVMVVRQYLPASASLLVTVGFLFAFVTSVAGNMLAPARMLMTFAEDRVGPKVLAHIQPRFHTPDIALITGLFIGLVLLWTQSFLFMLNAALVAMMLLYIVHTITLALLPFVNPTLYHSARLRPHPAILIAAAVIAAGTMGWMCYKTVAQVWWLLLAWAAVGTLLYGVSIVLGRREGHDYGEVRQIPTEIGDQR